MRARPALIAFVAMVVIYALVRHPEVVLVPAFLIGSYMLVRPRHGWLRGRR
ncbi:hypothetical protein [Nocardia tengchongensis]|uniref:hypothetical protein n=1 Tax=Nocardia tengchongensis TaxID=2055889 RepID=UPI00369A176B